VCTEPGTDRRYLAKFIKEQLKAQPARRPHAYRSEVLVEGVSVELAESIVRKGREHGLVMRAVPRPEVDAREFLQKAFVVPLFVGALCLYIAIAPGVWRWLAAPAFLLLFGLFKEKPLIANAAGLLPARRLSDPRLLRLAPFFASKVPGELKELVGSVVESHLLLTSRGATDAWVQATEPVVGALVRVAGVIAEAERLLAAANLQELTAELLARQAEGGMDAGLDVRDRLQELYEVDDRIFRLQGCLIRLLEAYHGQVMRVHAERAPLAALDASRLTATAEALLREAGAGHEARAALEEAA
jgi:hypothetical protein